MSATIWSMLRERFAAPTYAYLEEVRNGTGYSGRVRTADALAMCTWPSRGLELHGIEVKISRSDWLRELKDPAKSAEIQRFCDRWWVAIPNNEIVKVEELPKTWGLLVPRGSRLVAVVDAPLLESEPISKRLIASILRKVTETYVPRSQINARIEAARTEGRTSGLDTSAADLKRAQTRIGTMEAQIRAFEGASGLRLGVNDWDTDAREQKNLGEAVRLTLRMQDQRRALAELEAQARSIANGLASELNRMSPSAPEEARA